VFNASHFFPPDDQEPHRNCESLHGSSPLPGDPFMSCLASPNMLDLATSGAMGM